MRWSHPRILLMIVAVTLVAMPLAALGGSADAGKATFMVNCASCHGETGKGDGPVGVALQPPPRDLSQGEFMFDTDGDGAKGSDADLTNVIKNGAAKYGGSPLMAPWPTLKDEDVANLIAFLRTLKQ
jgi:mono/diheme cytochrome c family protein